jgi:pimeloyl-ACP methyl ester carboxylesterase
VIEQLSIPTAAGSFDAIAAGPEDGAPVLLLHGFPAAAVEWEYQVGVLGRHGFRAVAPDQRGYSPDVRPESAAEYGVGELVGDVVAMADQLGWHRFHLVGHDWGAAVGWALAGRHADRLGTLTAVSVPHPASLVRSFAGSQALRSWYMLMFQVPGLAERLFRAGGGSGLRRMLVSSGMPDPEPSVRLLTDQRAATAALNWYRAIRLPGNLRAGRTRVPTLYVWSDRDAALGRRAAEGTEAFVDAPYRFTVLSGVSHWIPEERPAELAALLLEHLAAHPLD